VTDQKCTDIEFVNNFIQFHDGYLPYQMHLPCCGVVIKILDYVTVAL